MEAFDTTALVEFYIRGQALRYWSSKENWDQRSIIDQSFFMTVIEEYRIETVLDIGCAAGYTACEIASKNEGVLIDAIDVLAPAVQLAHSNLRQFYTDVFQSRRVNFLVRDWRNLDGLPRSSYDLLLSVGSSLHHEERRCIPDLINYWRSHIRSSGIFVVEQRNYDLLFRERPTEISTSFGGRCFLKYRGEHKLEFTYPDFDGSKFARIECELFFEDELLRIIGSKGFEHLSTSYDYGEGTFEKSTWCQYIFRKI
jgi:SAM-dependent methyltransferase